jgi:hypothetical protein
MMLRCISRSDRQQKVRLLRCYQLTELTVFSGDKLPTVSSGIAKLRQFLTENKEKDSIYGRAANGSFPLVVHAENEFDIQQLIKIKQETPALDLVLFGGGGAHLVANELAAANIPVVLTANRGAPDTFEKINTLPGPPLSKMPAEILSNAGVTFGLAIEGESKFLQVSSLLESLLTSNR